MTLTRLLVALIIVTVVLSSCSRREAPPAAAAVPAAVAQLEAEIGTRFRRPWLQGLLMLPDSFVGGSFPQQIADLLREIEEFEGQYLSLLQESATEPQAVIETHQAFVTFARVTAELYEVMAASPDSIKSMRDGLEISDAALLAQYNRRVDEVNAARDEFEAALQALTTDQLLPFSRMGLTTHLAK